MGCGVVVVVVDGGGWWWWVAVSRGVGRGVGVVWWWTEYVCMCTVCKLHHKKFRLWKNRSEMSRARSTTLFKNRNENHERTRFKLLL